MNVWIQLPIRLAKKQDQKSSMRHWVSFSEWGWERVSFVFNYKGCQYIRTGQWYTNVNILRLAVRYLKVTISGITQRLEQGIATDGFRKFLENAVLCRYGYGFGLPTSGRWGHRTDLELNRTTLAFWPRAAGGSPRPVAKTTFWQSMNSFWQPGVRVINTASIRCYMNVSFSTFKISGNTYSLNYLCYTWSPGRHLVGSSIAPLMKSVTLPNVYAFILSKLLIALMGVPRPVVAFSTQTAHERT